jgi:ubiquinone/menaquinone biosynthesis C-methylase UbiE
VLDLACGTGIYLEKQIAFYRGCNIDWYGVDLSEEMLQKAKDKKLDARLLHGDALDLPYENDFFDFIKVRFAIHHFSDKPKASREMYRVLRNGGILSIQNLAHDYMRRAWPGEYFPSTIEIDEERFPSSLDLFSILTELGFDVEAKITVTIQQLRYKEILREARNRDMSQLTMISDDEYLRGMAQIESDSKATDFYIGDTALLDFTCRKRG